MSNRSAWNWSWLTVLKLSHCLSKRKSYTLQRTALWELTQVKQLFLPFLSSLHPVSDVHFMFFASKFPTPFNITALVENGDLYHYVLQSLKGFSDSWPFFSDAMSCWLCCADSLADFNPSAPCFPCSATAHHFLSFYTEVANSSCIANCISYTGWKHILLPLFLVLLVCCSGPIEWC